jgi:hypothetical protein
LNTFSHSFCFIFAETLAAKGDLQHILDIERKFREAITKVTNFKFVNVTVADEKNKEMIPDKGELVEVLKLSDKDVLDIEYSVRYCDVAFSTHPPSTFINMMNDSSILSLDSNQDCPSCDIEIVTMY